GPGTGKSSTRLCGWRLHSTDDLLLPRRLLCVCWYRGSGTARCAAPRKITLPACLSRVQAVCATLLKVLAGVEPRGFEPLTSAVQRRRSPNEATAPDTRCFCGCRRATSGWASLESNQGPQSYQDCALAD